MTVQNFMKIVLTRKKVQEFEVFLPGNSDVSNAVVTEFLIKNGQFFRCSSSTSGIYHGTHLSECFG